MPEQETPVAKLARLSMQLVRCTDQSECDRIEAQIQALLAAMPPVILGDRRTRIKVLQVKEGS